MSDDLNGQGWQGTQQPGLPPQDPSTPTPPQNPQAPMQPPPPAKSNSKMAIIIILVVLAVLAIPCIGIIAAIAIPNFANAVERGKQKRSMSEVRTIATAVLVYSTDNEGQYPNVQTGYAADLAPYLEPDYIHNLPDLDGWENPYEYYYLIDDDGVPFFQVISRGRESEPDDFVGGYFTGEPGVTTNCFESDIIWQEDTFAKRPEGKQRRCI